MFAKVAKIPAISGFFLVAPALASAEAGLLPGTEPGDNGLHIQGRFSGGFMGIGEKTTIRD